MSIFILICLLIPYVTLNFIISIIIYKRYKIFTSTKNAIANDLINLNEEYSEFKRYDNVSFIRIFSGMVLIFWIKALIITCIALNLGFINT